MQIDVRYTVANVVLVDTPDCWKGHNHTFRLGDPKNMPDRLWIPRPEKDNHVWIPVELFFNNVDEEFHLEYQRFLNTYRMAFIEGCVLEPKDIPTHDAITRAIRQYNAYNRTIRSSFDRDLLNMVLWMKIMYPLLGEVQAMITNLPSDHPHRLDLTSLGFGSVIYPGYMEFLKDYQCSFLPRKYQFHNPWQYCIEPAVIYPFVRNALLYSNSGDHRHIASELGSTY